MADYTTLVYLILGILCGSIGVWVLLSKKSSTTNNTSDDNLLEHLKQTTATLQSENESLRETLSIKEQELAVATSKLSQMTETMQTWEKTFEEKAQIALSQSARTLSQQLLEEHQRETKKSTEENKKQMGETTQKLFTEFTTISEKVKSLNDDVSKNSKNVDAIEQALSNPHSMGQASEAILENTLKSFGLRRDVDFTTQNSVAGDNGGKLRPDAMVYLPNETVLVIDSKASKFMMDMAHLETNSPQYKSATEQLAGTMRKHLKDLTMKDYSKAVEKDYKAHKSSPVRDVMMVMWLATDGLLETLRQTDPDIFTAAINSNIFITGPSGLWSAIGVASRKITLQQQNENQQVIIDSIGDLLNTISTVVSHAEKVERGLNSAQSSFENMKKSINGRLLSRSNKIVELGAPAPTKPLPLRIGKSDDDSIIDPETPPQIEEQ